MDSAILLAKIFGPFLAILGLWMLLYETHFGKVMTSMKKTPSSMFNDHIVELLGGLVIITFYNSWTMDIYFFVTLLGWVCFVRGLVGLFMPELFLKVTMPKSGWKKALGVIPLLWGLILIWAGFYQ